MLTWQKFLPGDRKNSTSGWAIQRFQVCIIKPSLPIPYLPSLPTLPTLPIGGFIKGILRGVRCTKSLRVLFLHRRPPSWTTPVLYSRAVFIFNEPALCTFQICLIHTQANRPQKLGLVWRNIKKISQIIKDYFCLLFFLLIILWWPCSRRGL